MFNPLTAATAVVAAVADGINQAQTVIGATGGSVRIYPPGHPNHPYVLAHPGDPRNGQRATAYAVALGLDDGQDVA